jgi:ABC-2 type transport system permease protein
MKILAIIWKDTLTRFADRSEILFFLVLPVVFTFMISGGASGNSASSIPVLVVDQDTSLLSAEFVNSLAASEVVEPHLVTPEQAQKEFSQKKAPALVTLPQGFEAALLDGLDVQLGLEKTPNDRNADIVEQAVRASAGSMSRSLAFARGNLASREGTSPLGEAERRDFLFHSLQEAEGNSTSASSRVLVTRPQQLETITYDQASQASAGQVITWVLIPLLGTSALFTWERDQKTLLRLVSTPTRKATFLLGTISSQLILAVIQMAILMGFGVVVLGVQWGRSPTGLALIMVSFALASVAMGVMLGTIVRSERQANNLSIMMGMVMALLGGCWWPLELFPQVLQKVVRVLPTTWAMQGFTDLIYRGSTWIGVLPSASVLFGFAVIFFVVGVMRFKYE